jgi:hypothetical protein
VPRLFHPARFGFRIRFSYFPNPLPGSFQVFSDLRLALKTVAGRLRLDLGSICTTCSSVISPSALISPNTCVNNSSNSARYSNRKLDGVW